MPCAISASVVPALGPISQPVNAHAMASMRAAVVGALADPPTAWEVDAIAAVSDALFFADDGAALLAWVDPATVMISSALAEGSKGAGAGLLPSDIVCLSGVWIATKFACSCSNASLPELIQQVLLGRSKGEESDVDGDGDQDSLFERHAYVDILTQLVVQVERLILIHFDFALPNLASLQPKV